ncbi:MAG: methyltransferase domain-containing protein [Deltaproteobacteria bacterium]|nr:methyltransferase domain-containing protein [Deltaproteobacteria bacterium]
MPRALLAEQLARHVPPTARPLAVLATAADLRAVAAAFEEACLVSHGSSTRRTARRGRIGRTLRGDATRLPFADRALGAVVAICTLGRADDPRAALGELRRALRDGGQLFVVERLADGGLAHLWRRLGGRSGTAVAAEELTALLLNADFTEIGQTTLGGSRPRLLTSARLRVLPGEELGAIR